MWAEIKIGEINLMTIFYTSDEHYFHSRILIHANRDFKDVEEMNREIIARHNSVVKTEDIVYHLGDFSFRENQVADLLKQLNGTKHLISGNHCPTHSCHKKHNRSIKHYLEYGFASVQENLELQIGNHKVLLQHLPFLNENDKDQRYSQYRPIDTGQFLLCGHVHEKWAVRGRQINVGVDQHNFYPVSEDEILAIIADILEGEQK